MKRILIAGAFALAAGGQAFAADLPPPAPAPRAPAVYTPVAAVYNWTGFYIGGNLGVGWSGISLSDAKGTNFTSTSSTSFLGGGQVGFNYQFWGGIVIGAEAQFDWLPNTKNTITATNGASTATATINNRWLTLATGRVGYAWDRVLVYGKGGGAWAGSGTSSFSTGPISGPSTTWGWTAGAGLEWAFYGNWSARAEWDYVRLTGQTYTVGTIAGSPFSGDVITSNNRTINMFTAGVNYKFGPW